MRCSNEHNKYYTLVAVEEEDTPKHNIIILLCHTRNDRKLFDDETAAISGPMF